MSNFLPPGSPIARDAGCICPVLDNAHGNGYLGDSTLAGWVMREDCPLHGDQAIEIGKGESEKSFPIVS